MLEHAIHRFRALPQQADRIARIPDIHPTRIPTGPKKKAKSSMPSVEKCMDSTKTKCDNPFVPRAPLEARQLWDPRYTVSNAVPQSASDRAELVSSLKFELHGLSKDRSTLLAFTDGSRCEPEGIPMAGAGYVFVHHGKNIAEGRFSLGTQITSSESELFALSQAAVQLPNVFRLPSLSTVTKLVFLVDNTFAIASIGDLSPHPRQLASFIFRKHIDQFLARNAAHRVQVRWCPGHHGIAGNEHAHNLARSAATFKPDLTYIPEAFAQKHRRA